MKRSKIGPIPLLIVGFLGGLFLAAALSNFIDRAAVRGIATCVFPLGLVVFALLLVQTFRR